MSQCKWCPNIAAAGHLNFLAEQATKASIPAQEKLALPRPPMIRASVSSHQRGGSLCEGVCQSIVSTHVILSFTGAGNVERAQSYVLPVWQGWTHLE